MFITDHRKENVAVTDNSCVCILLHCTAARASTMNGRRHTTDSQTNQGHTTTRRH